MGKKMSKVRRIGLIWMILLPLWAQGQDSLRCAYCGKPFEGRYLSYQGKNYHEECFERICLKCNYCGKFIIEAKYFKIGEQNYHQDCYINHICTRCDLCGEALVGEYATDVWGARYHIEHEDKLDRCHYCARIIGEKTSEGGYRFDDGHIMCGICFKTIISNTDQLEAMIINVTEILEDHGIEVDLSDIPVIMTDIKTLDRMTKSVDPQRYGLCYYETEVIDDIIRCKDIKIYISQGIPLRTAEGVLAHEIAHAWMDVNVKEAMPEWLCEGTAVYACYLVYNQHSDKLAELLIDNIKEDPNEVFGEGFRRVSKYVQANGMETLLRSLKEKGRIDD